MKKGKTISLALGPALNRTQELTQRLAAEILSGRLQPGARLPTEQELSIATGVSRKYAIPLLEYLDREHVTRRVGDERVIL